MTHTETGVPLPNPVPSLWCLGVLRRHAMLHRCSGPIHQCSTMWRAKQCSTEQCHDGSTVETHLCLFFFTKGCQTTPAMTLLEGSPICLKESFGLCINHEPICEKEFGLDKTGRQNKNVLSPHTAGQEVLSTTHGGSRISK